MVYEWKNGSRIKADASKVGKEIASLGKEITAENVVRKARDDGSALHNCFEWDDSAAAEEYRLVQAREIMRSLVVIIDKPDEPKGVTTVRAYENVDLAAKDSGESRRAYVPTAKALAKPELRAQIIARLGDDIRQAEDTAGKYEYLESKFGDVKAKLSSAREALPV
jgi:hypothetical protein